MEKAFPTWVEIKAYECSKDYLEYLLMKNELVLDSTEYYVYFYGIQIKLLKQEYKFLLHILKKNGKKIRAEKLMKEIDSKAKPEKYNDTAYKIKYHIKNKINSKWIELFPISSQQEWFGFERDYENEINGMMQLDFSTRFKSLIRIQEGQYLTDFKSYKKSIKR